MDVNEAKGSQLAYTFKAKIILTIPTSNNDKKLPTFRLDTLVFLRATMKLVS